MRPRILAALLSASVVAISCDGAAETLQRRGDEGSVLTAEAPAPPTAQVVLRFKPKTGAMALAWSPDGRFLATTGGLDGRITLWDARTGSAVWDVQGENMASEALAFSNDGRLLLTATATAASRATLTLWDVASGHVAGNVAGPYPEGSYIWNFARHIALDPARSLMAVIAAQEPGAPVAIYKTGDWAIAGTVMVPKDIPRAVALGPDDQLAIGTIRGLIALFDTRTRTLKRVMNAGEAGVGAVVFSPDGKEIASGALAGGAEPLKIWRTTDGMLVQSYKEDVGHVNGLAWSPDGKYLASASFEDEGLHLWPLTAKGVGEAVASFRGGAWSVAFSPDGKFLAGGSSEGDVAIAQIR